jgi:hypothetical protein
LGFAAGDCTSPEFQLLKVVSLFWAANLEHAASGSELTRVVGAGLTVVASAVEGFDAEVALAARPILAGDDFLSEPMSSPQPSRVH